MNDTNDTIPDHSRSSTSSYNNRVTFRATDTLLEDIEELVQEDVFENQSEALRQLVQEGISSLDDV